MYREMISRRIATYLSFDSSTCYTAKHSKLGVGLRWLDSWLFAASRSSDTFSLHTIQGL